MTLYKTDIEQLEKHDLTLEKVRKQIHLFKTGINTVNLKSAATLGDGIIPLSTEAVTEFSNYFDAQKNFVSLLKFVPASGAATRMFTFLSTFLKNYNPENESINAYINRTKDTQLNLFIIGLEKYPFYNNVVKQLPESYKTLSSDEKIVVFIQTMLHEKTLNYSNFPKGLLPFHNNNNIISTAFEAHLYEGALYASSNKITKLHFTVSKAHTTAFQQELKHILERISQETGKTFEVSFSFQKKRTDSVALTNEKTLFRDKNNQLIFYPSGHGALIENLNELNDDIIFIKNIDNVLPNTKLQDTAVYKKALAGILLKTQKEVFAYQKELENNNLSENRIVHIANYLINTLNIVISSEFEKYAQKYQIAYLSEKLNRPIRVCGMVKNEGEPGGGPFWVKNEHGQVSLQIIESSQVNNLDFLQNQILSEATHFNPVDIVCGVKNYKGDKFDLTQFVNHKTSFISSKTRFGQELKILELPGLWNGGMANWNSIFVEVPLHTFNPVKTITDLLKPVHQ